MERCPRSFGTRHGVLDVAHRSWGHRLHRDPGNRHVATRTYLPIWAAGRHGQDVPPFMLVVTVAYMHDDELNYEEHDHVGVITINRPEARNALGWSTYTS